MKDHIIWYTQKYALPPNKKHDTDAGYDFYAFEDTVIPAHSRKLVSTGVYWEPQSHGFLKIMPRSSLALIGITVDAGVIDADYRGEIKIILVNNSPSDYSVNLHDKIAQGVYFSIPQPTSEVKTYDELQVNTERGQGGFGSTGKR
jgi:dUTP pyrophosphatase